MAQEITGALKLFRVQDARAALPQNCSPSKIERSCISAYGTSVPWPLQIGRSPQVQVA